MSGTISINRKVRIRPIALPVEHGAWGFLLEPLVASVIVAASPAAPWIFLLATAAFLARQPLKVFLADRRAGRNLPQTSVAARFALVFGLIAVAATVGLVNTTSPLSLWPLLVAAPFAFWQLERDARRQSRGLWSELTGAVAVSSTAGAVALAAGWKTSAALALWAIFAARLAGSIVYVHTRLALEKRRYQPRTGAVAINVLFFLLSAAAAWWNYIPALPVGVFGLLAIRAGWGLSAYRRPSRAVRIGVGEVLFGALLVLAVIGGYLGNG